MNDRLNPTPTFTTATPARSRRRARRIAAGAAIVLVGLGAFGVTAGATDGSGDTKVAAAVPAGTDVTFTTSCITISGAELASMTDASEPIVTGTFEVGEGDGWVVAESEVAQPVAVALDGIPKGVVTSTPDGEVVWGDAVSGGEAGSCEDLANVTPAKPAPSDAVVEQR